MRYGQGHWYLPVFWVHRLCVDFQLRQGAKVWVQPSVRFKVQEGSRIFKKVQEGSRRFKKVQGGSRRFNEVQEGSRIEKGSRRF